MAIFNWIVIGLWALFLLVWIFSSLYTKKNVRRNYFRGLVLRVVAIAIIVFLFRTPWTAQWYANVPPVQAGTNPVLGLIGVLLCMAGIAFAIWARVYIGSNWGMPMSVKRDAELVIAGPYAYVRHPIYSGVLLAILGSALVVGVWWFAIFIVSVFYFVWSAFREEKIMTEAFPEGYPAYRKRTKMLVPFMF
jgi:protein-S-isoprenylcysteine O-methyltransferase Ste14